MSRPHFRTYALGWFQQDYKGRQLDYHTGSLTGMIAINGLVREEGIGVYLLANTSTEIRHALMFKVFDMLMGMPRRDWSGEMLALYKTPAAAQSAEGTARSQDSTARAGSAPAYEAYEVDKPVSIAKASAPKYPDELRRDGIAGTVGVSFVVDSIGRVDLATFKVVSSRHELFTKSVKDALTKTRYNPAELKGRKVRQIVTQEFQFSR